MEEKEQITIGQLSLRQISLVKSVLSRKGFLFENVKEDSSKEGYTTYGTLKTSNAIIVVRLSNHKCSMKNWTERYKANNFYNIVFNAFDDNHNHSEKRTPFYNDHIFNPKEVEDNGLIAQIASDLCNLMNVQTISIV